MTSLRPLLLAIRPAEGQTWQELSGRIAEEASLPEEYRGYCMVPPPFEIFLPCLKQTLLSKNFKETRKNTELFKTTVFH